MRGSREHDEYQLLGIHDGRYGAEAHDGDGGPEGAGVALRLNVRLRRFAVVTAIKHEILGRPSLKYAA
jgi:hypothetical protein